MTVNGARRVGVTPDLVYHAHASVMQAVRAFAQARHVTEILASPVATSFEFAPDRTYYFGSERGPDLVLPASNTVQKQVACAWLGSVFCIAPCFRREPPDKNPKMNLHVFHQVEVELLGAGVADARTFAIDLLAAVLHTFPAEMRAPDLQVFESVASLDLLDVPDPPTYDEYDDWLARIEIPAHPLWILNIPQNPHLNFNQGIPGTRLSRGFELILPDGYGEVLSGGNRNIDVLRVHCNLDQTPTGSAYSGSSGFGIGFERLLAWLLGEQDISTVRPAHFS